MEKARLRMQEQYAAASSNHAAAQKVKDEERSRAKLAEAEAKLRGEGGRRMRAAEDQPAQPRAVTKKKDTFRSGKVVVA